MATWIEIQSTKTDTEIQTEILAAMALANLPTSSWVVGGFWHNFTLWIARLLVIVYALIKSMAKAAWLDTADGQSLADLAAGTYGTPKRIETFATGSVTFLNSSGAPLDEVIEAITIQKDADPSITYKNSEAAYALNGDSVTVDFVCDVAGTVGNAIADGVSLVTTLPGVTITSSTAFVGQDEQADEDLRVLATKQAAVLSTAHGNKYEWIALNTNTDGTLAESNDGKTRCNINRARVSFEDDQGRVYVWLAAPSGAVDSGEYATTIAALETYALTNPGVIIDSNVSTVTVNINATIEVRKGRSTDGVSDEIEERLEEYFPNTSIGGDDGYITLDELKLEIGRANANIHKVTLTTPGADVALADDEVAVLGTVTLSVINQP